MTKQLRPAFKVETPDGEDRDRSVCEHCGFIDYVNPKIVAGSVVVAEDGRILLCRRAIDPRKGFWTLPAGFMEEGETVEEAAGREAAEEANADIAIERVLAVYSVPRISQVQIMFRARLRSDVSPGPESLETRLFQWKDLPWSELAFPTVVWALSHYAATRTRTDFAPFVNPDGVERVVR